MLALLALLLDYGFYVGIRAARAIELFQEELTALSSKSPRGLPELPPHSSAPT